MNTNVNTEYLVASVTEHRRMEWLEEQLAKGYLVTVSPWPGPTPRVILTWGKRANPQYIVGATIREAIDDILKQVESSAPSET